MDCLILESFQTDHDILPEKQFKKILDFEYCSQRSMGNKIHGIFKADENALNDFNIQIKWKYEILAIDIGTMNSIHNECFQQDLNCWHEYVQSI